MTVVQPWSSKGLEITLHDLGLLSGPGVGPDVAPLSEVGHPRACRPSSPERGPGRKVAAWVRRGPGDDLVVALLSVGRGRAGCRSSSLSTSLSNVSRLARPGSASSSASSCCRGPGDVGSTSATSRSRRSAESWSSLATVAAQKEPVGRGGAGAGYQPVDSAGWLKVLVPAAGQQ